MKKKNRSKHKTYHITNKQRVCLFMIAFTCGEYLGKNNPIRFIRRYLNEAKMIREKYNYPWYDPHITIRNEQSYLKALKKYEKVLQNRVV